MSHPAAVIPFARGRLVPSALVIGSIAPDTPYFFFMMELRAQTHRPLGMVSVDLTMALFVYTVFHMLWRAPLVALSPAALRHRLPAPRPLLSPWLLPSLFLGIVTHVFWDGFTHHDHGFATGLPWLVTISFGGLELYRWLQYVSGAAGLLIMAWWLVRWFRNTPADASPASFPAPAAASVRARLVAGVLFTVGAVAGGGYGGLLEPDVVPAGDAALHVRLVGAVIGVIAGLVVAVTVFALGWRLAAGPATTLQDPPETLESREVLQVPEGEVLEGKVVSAAENAATAGRDAAPVD